MNEAERRFRIGFGRAIAERSLVEGDYHQAEWGRWIWASAMHTSPAYPWINLFEHGFRKYGMGRDYGYTSGGLTLRWNVQRGGIVVDQEFDPPLRPINFELRGEPFRVMHYKGLAIGSPFADVITKYDRRVANRILAEFALLTPEQMKGATGYGILATVDYIRHQVRGEWRETKPRIRKRITGPWPESMPARGYMG